MGPRRGWDSAPAAPNCLIIGVGSRARPPPWRHALAGGDTAGCPLGCPPGRGGGNRGGPFAGWQGGGGQGVSPGCGVRVEGAGCGVTVGLGGVFGAGGSHLGLGQRRQQKPGGGMGAWSGGAWSGGAWSRKGAWPGRGRGGEGRGVGAGAVGGAARPGPGSGRLWGRCRPGLAGPA